MLREFRLGLGGVPFLAGFPSGEPPDLRIERHSPPFYGGLFLCPVGERNQRLARESRPWLPCSRDGHRAAIFVDRYKGKR